MKWHACSFFGTRIESVKINSPKEDRHVLLKVVTADKMHVIYLM